MKTAHHTEGFLKRNAAKLDKITRAHTAFQSFDAMLNADGGYFPTIGRFEGSEFLADCYDSAQFRRCDSRRAYRANWDRYEASEQVAA
jgi:hypothetical protein